MPTLDELYNDRVVEHHELGRQGGVTLEKVAGREVYVCSVCKARGEPKDRKRFAKRHPRLCSERREFTRQLASGTRPVARGDEGD